MRVSPSASANVGASVNIGSQVEAPAAAGSGASERRASLEQLLNERPLPGTLGFGVAVNGGAEASLLAAPPAIDTTATGRRGSTGFTPTSGDGRTPTSRNRRRSSGASVVRKRRRSSVFQKDKKALMGPIVQTPEDVKKTLRQKLWSLVDEPASSQAARFIAIFIMTLIAISCITFCLETLPAFHRKNVTVWFVIEAVCIAFFTLEYVARLVSCPSLIPFLKDTLNTIDLIAIVPFYIELFFDNGGSGSAVFRVVRLVRVFRVFKISRYVSWVKIFANAMYASAQPLGMLLFVMAIGCVVFSSAIYFAERGDYDEVEGRYMRYDIDGMYEPSPYQSIPASFWWCIITMTTVGYGDHYPVTFAGKLIAAVTSLSGILVLAIPITVISTNFNYEFGRMKKKREAMRQKMLMFKRQFAMKQTHGLGIIKDEIDALVRRNAAELMEDFQSVVQASKDELGAELYALVQVAYRQRERIVAETLRQQVSGGPAGGGAAVQAGAAKQAGTPAQLQADGQAGQSVPSGPRQIPGFHNGSSASLPLNRVDSGVDAKVVAGDDLNDAILQPGADASGFSAEVERSAASK